MQRKRALLGVAISTMIVCFEDELEHIDDPLPAAIPIDPEELEVQEEEEFALHAMMMALGAYHTSMGILHPLPTRKLARLDVTIASLDDHELLIRTWFNRDKLQ